MNHNHLKIMREHSGLTQVQLGELLGLNLIPSTKNPDRFECPQITRIETGRAKTIDFSFAQKWAVNCGFKLHSESEILIKNSDFLNLRKIKVRYLNIIKSTGINNTYDFVSILCYRYFPDSDKRLIGLDEYFELIDISEKYHKILKTIHE